MPAKKSAPKSKSKSKSSTPASAPALAPAPAPVEVAAAESTPKSETNPPISSWSDIEAQFTGIAQRLKEFKEFQTSLTSDVRLLQRNVQRFIKDSARKNKRKKKVVDPNKPKRAPSGFAKPALISSQLCTFLGKAEGTEMARTEVTKFLTNYIKVNNLQDPSNKRRILPDKKLGKLLNAGKGEEVTYFNLQKYMKVHFPKSAAATAAAATASS